MQNLKENNNLIFIRSPTAEACSLQSFAMMLQTMLLILPIRIDDFSKAPAYQTRNLFFGQLQQQQHSDQYPRPSLVQIPETHASELMLIYRCVTTSSKVSKSQ
jgi:hypothetical protein